jgi:hypothetical protein
MKISGLMILRNAVANDYPFVEAIHSVLPMVDEMVISIDRGEDDTEEKVKAIGSPKIKIFYSEWDMSLREGGRVYAVETNKAKEHISADADWIFYLQADEIIHEKYQPVILEAAQKYLRNKRVEGLLFKYLHFYATYDYVGNSRKWYKYEVRLIKNNPSISSYKDAQGFRVGNQKIKVVPVNAEVYHYGWVKSPEQMKKKLKNVLPFYNNNDDWIEIYRKGDDYFDFKEEFDSLSLFSGTHPEVMKERIDKKNWTVNLDITRRRFSMRDKLLFLLERITGKRFFEFKNYKIIRP